MLLKSFDYYTETLGKLYFKSYVFPTMYLEIVKS